MESNQSVTEKAKFGSVSKTLQKTSFKTLERVPMLLSFVDLSTTFCPKSSAGTLNPDPMEFTFLAYFSISESHSLCKLIFKVSKLQERPKFGRFQEALIY